MKSNKTGVCEVFIVKEIGVNRISLKSCFGKYLIAEGSAGNFEVIANGDKDELRTIFKVEKNPEGKVSLNTNHGRYIAVTAEGKLNGKSFSADGEAIFIPHCVEGKN